MTFLFYLIVVLHVLACLFLIGVVLLQQGRGQDLASAFGGGGTQTAFGPRGSATVLSRATAILAGVFMVTSLTLSLLKPRASGILDQVPAAAATPSPRPASSALPLAVPPVTQAPAAPAPPPAKPAEAPVPTGKAPAPAATPAGK